MRHLLVLTFSCCFLLGSLSAKADTGNPIIELLPTIQRLLNTSGTVYSVQQGRKTSAISNTDEVSVRISKTGGKAKTEIKICLASNSAAGTLTTVKKTYTFDNGNYTRTKTFTISGARNKAIVVYINNKSFSNKFKYTLRVDEE